MRRFRANTLLSVTLATFLSTAAWGQQSQVQLRGDSISIRIVDTDLRAAVQMLGQYLDLPVLFTGNPGTMVTLEAPRPVARQDILPLLRGLVESQSFELVEDTTAGLYRVRPKESLRPSAARPQAQEERGQDVVQLYVIPLQHARAVDVASTINALYGSGGEAGSREAQRVPTLGDELRDNLIPPVDRVDSDAAPPRRAAQLSGELTIVSDSRGNGLLVRANSADIILIREVVRALDVRPLQVLIEVLVAEVRRDRSLGINVEGTLQPTSIGKSGSTVEGSIGSTGLGDFALRVMGIGGLDLEGTLRLAAANGTVRILTRPVVLATNNQVAEIVVGSQRPFVQVQRALPTDGATRDQVVQYKDVGTKLTVRPTISMDGSVQLEVTQEVSSATSELAFNAPVISTRSISTQLLVRDGQTVALGGLTDRQREIRQEGLPILSSIPFLGGLFGAAKRQTIETELFVFLTPRVIRTDDDASRLTAPLRDRARDRD